MKNSSWAKILIYCILVGALLFVFLKIHTAIWGADLYEASRVKISKSANSPVAHIFLGRPRQEFTVAIDTSSNSLWLVSRVCKDIGCQYKKRYDERKSETFDHLYLSSIVLFGQAKANGYRALEELTIGGIKRKEQDFIIATGINGTLAYDGVLGLGVGKSQRPSFLENLNSSLTLPVFSIYLRPSGGFLNSDHVDYYGDLLFGAIDESKFTGDLSYVPIRNDPQDSSGWIMKLDHVAVQNHTTSVIGGEEAILSFRKVVHSQSTASLDTTIDGVRGPVIEVLELNSLINATYNATLDLGVFKDCETLGKREVVFKLEGKLFTLKPEAYMLKDKGGSCVSIFRATPEYMGRNWILGLPFLERHYVVYDFGRLRVGMAEANHQLDY